MTPATPTPAPSSAPAAPARAAAGGGTARWTVDEPGPADFAAWRELFRGYCAFYRVPMPPEKAELVWSWLTDPAHELDGLLVRDTDGTPVGLAHYRPFSRPLHGAVGGFLDDLFVRPDVRGGGAVDALLARLRAIAGERGWNVVRWITADDNHRARSKYDQVATRTMFVTYDMAPDAG
ncbi:GNAT family N-acetyltransferase [Kitasatospora sp. CM 4170]|uniref:GNAT family N-acetyltransferase n=1 Tax=Kitasatospora aburaviensis TaxID=67265 RepID=A0ABW1EWX2_9ACTN|nr:GNAT family N-acetyltransferase [Kitasatospora sp. CM 4170]WNM44014.1 GNAT family N-acetyltransferase [Kitasatospora sp. CM 4170]